jgi:hypothetical protein
MTLVVKMNGKKIATYEADYLERIDTSWADPDFTGPRTPLLIHVWKKDFSDYKKWVGTIYQWEFKNLEVRWLTVPETKIPIG